MKNLNYMGKISAPINSVARGVGVLVYLQSLESGLEYQFGFSEDFEGTIVKVTRLTHCDRL